MASTKIDYKCARWIEGSFKHDGKQFTTQKLPFRCEADDAEVVWFWVWLKLLWDLYDVLSEEDYGIWEMKVIKFLKSLGIISEYDSKDGQIAESIY